MCFFAKFPSLAFLREDSRLIGTKSSSSSESCCLDLWKFDRFMFEENPEETWGRLPILPLLGLVNEPEVRGLKLEVALEDAVLTLVGVVEKDLVLVGATGV